VENIITIRFSWFKWRDIIFFNR